MEVQSFFSIGADLIPVNEAMAFDIYVNSSAREGKEKFVRIFPKGEAMGAEDIDRLKKKFHQLYVPESQRKDYLNAVTKSTKINDAEKTTVIKSTAIQYLGKIFDHKKEFSTELLTETIQGCRDSVESMVDVIQDYSVDKLRDMIASLSFHDFYTYDHSINVSMYCILIYRSIFPKAERARLVEAGLGGLLHDLGKIKIPTHIINNPGKLSDEEFQQIKNHPDYGLEMLDATEAADNGIDMEVISRIVHEHHENFNGSGYPTGLQGEEIHILARIVAIADFFDAITTKRSYHEAMTPEDAVNVMSQSKGKKLDPKLFEHFTQAVKTFARKGTQKWALPDSYDPCQPQNELPLAEVTNASDDPNFGKIVIQESKRKAS